ncbi:MAG: kinase/pyrophosphorylase, partial [Candidatus Methylomirabilales bacterium]
IVLGVAPPAGLLRLKRRPVGLTVKPERLVEFRRVRIRQLKVGLPISYAEPRHVRAELAYGRQLFRQGDFPVVDVTDKSLEETATEVVAVLQGPGDRSRARD